MFMVNKESNISLRLAYSNLACIVRKMCKMPKSYPAGWLCKSTPKSYSARPSVLDLWNPDKQGPTVH